MANETVFKRYKGNPIITPKNLDGLDCNSIFNSAVVRYGKGYIGVFRVDTQAMRQQMHVGRSRDGVKWAIEPQPLHVTWDDPDYEANPYGYDPRVTPLEGKYYVTYCNHYHGPTLGIMETTDFKTFKQLCNAVPPYNRNGVLFPRRINGKYAMLHRPSDRGHTPFGDIFYCSSPDLIHWGNHKFVFGTVGGWQSTKVGAGPVPIEIDDGWLLIYHGVLTSCNGYVYRAGAAILDKDEPWRVRYRCTRYLLSPTEHYECVGDTPNVVFPNAAIVYPDGKLALYYGCADTCIGLAHCYIDELIEFVKKNS
jgi:beta-1,4-mannooligosaccharide/beta-1,4-mannosyl-N-acetylglucosamine phosphorylase